MFQSRRALLVLGLGLVGAGCGTPAPNQEAAAEQLIVEPGQMAEVDKTVITFLGDSLTAGLGLTTSQAYPSRLQEMFLAEGYKEVEVVNAGESGDTTAGGLRRVESILVPNVRIIVVALGGNDALRGLSVSDSRQNLSSIINGVLARNVRVMLVGMEGPTNLGEDYRTSFRALYAELARQYVRNIKFVPSSSKALAATPSSTRPTGFIRTRRERSSSPRTSIQPSATWWINFPIRPSSRRHDD